MACLPATQSFQEDRKQRFFFGHSDMISCLAVYHTEDSNLLATAPGASGNRKGSASTIVCSGEFGARPRVCIWCAETCEVRQYPKYFMFRVALDTTTLSPTSPCTVMLITKEQSRMQPNGPQRLSKESLIQLSFWSKNVSLKRRTQKSAHKTQTSRPQSFRCSGPPKTSRRAVVVHSYLMGC